MSKENETEISVYETPTFRKAFKRLSEKNKQQVEKEIDLIIAKPEMGQQKKGDLAYLRVHKFSMNKQQVLLGYSWQASELIIYLLNIGSHENFYREARNRRKADLDLMK